MGTKETITGGNQDQEAMKEVEIFQAMQGLEEKDLIAQTVQTVPTKEIAEIERKGLPVEVMTEGIGHTAVTKITEIGPTAEVTITKMDHSVGVKIRLMKNASLQARVKRKWTNLRIAL